jgi:hypothetical protein
MAYVGPTTEGKHRITIYGPKEDGSYIVEFKRAAGQTLAPPLARRR